MTKRCFDRCGLDKTSSETLFISSFGQSGKKRKLDVTEVTFYRDKVSQDEKVSANVYIIDKIVSDIKSFNLSPGEQRYISNHGLILADKRLA